MSYEVITDSFMNENDYVSDNFGVRTPFSMLVVIGMYLLTVLKIGPSFMKSRPAYNLKSFIVVYNILQVLACIHLVHKIYTIDLPTLQFWKCVDYEPKSAVEKNFSDISIFVFWLKVVELSETVVFVLRKKQRQVSFLHVFHHCSTLFLAFHLNTTYRASSALYPIFINSLVHIIMYSYYLVAAILPAKTVEKLTPIKKSITIIQMVQFGMILTQVVIGLSRGCKVPMAILLIYVAIITAFFYMFYDFYQKNYNARQLAKEAKIKQDN